MSITREECEKDLRSGGFTQRVVYLGYFPVPHPVHFMTPDMRSVILNHCINSLGALSRSEEPPTPNSVLSLVLGEPKLLNKYVDITISAKNIAVVHDDVREKAKNGNLILRVPMKYTSVIERLEGTDYFAFIAKKLDGNNRRCSVFKTEKLELADHIMQIMEHAMNICNEEQMKEEETASGSATPQATTPIAPPSTGFPPVPTTPIGPPPVVPTPTKTQRQTPLNCNRIRLGPKAQELAQYRWYHGLLSRSDAVERLQRPGEFLIRESENQRGQVILSGMNDQQHEKHLLLIDHEGKVKTQDRDFTNIAELVSYYMRNETIIVMANENQLQLQFPVDRPH